MALGKYDALCSRCNTRLGKHTASVPNEFCHQYYCPVRTTETSRWNFDSRLLFIDGGKKRSRFCDNRNNPGLYF